MIHPLERTINLQQWLRRRERSALLKASGMLLLALPGIAIDNILFSGLLWVLLARFHLNFGGVFVICFVPSCALFGWLAGFGQWPDAGGETWSDQVFTTAGGHLDLSTMNKPRGSAGPGTLLLTALLLAGPKMLRTACRRFLAMARVRNADRQRSEQILHQLQLLDHSTAALDLQRPNEDPQALDECVSYLIVFGWLDTSTDHTRVWLNSAALAILDGDHVNRNPG